ncbi:vacuolar protein sorting-associated protein 54, chloroplastic isoform X2 [Magnolia sinica]|uniref:vacuolar protein sorting-associated protein 54, chloroplastic isoform X2 n=1 Tax=Magnolia sinica TaxID=86752 RepID=UPI00265A6084|nr:vacuolar protein sorting-associated protein 54, chloroplastic isoform X2 [Magnolia sinica]
MDGDDALPSQPGRPSFMDPTVQISPSKINSFPSRISSSSSMRTSSNIDSPSYLHTHSLGINQSLASILNNPHVGKSGVYGSDASWSSWWSSATASSAEFAPLNVTKPLSPDVSRLDFQPYLASILESYGRFEDIQHHCSEESRSDMEIKGQGEALVACLREVPSLYFKEDFALEDGATFRVACPFASAPEENAALQEKLSHYLDVVELHLVKEISLRSDSFFEAQGHLQDLNVEIVDTCVRIRDLKETMTLLDADLVELARQIQDLNATRSNLLALQQKLRLILYVNQALSALKLLVAAADCAGALDVTNDLQHLLDGDDLTGLHCFRHLRDELAMSIDSINSILSAEFMRASIHDAKDVDSVILSKLKERASNVINGKDDEVKLDDEESSSFRDRLLPIIIGLLRTAKLPSVLRLYRDKLIADMKMAIKTTVAELLPFLVARPVESDFTSGERTVDTDGGGLSLASKLRNLSSESFVQLLSAIFKVVQAHLVRAAEVKKVIEWIMGNLDGCYAADSVAAAVALGAAAAAAAETAQENDGQLGTPLPYSLQKNANKVLLLQGKPNEASTPSNMSKNFRADVLRENTEAVFAACDTAHGRWAKLLGVRALLHPKLRLQEFLSIYNITQDFITATEKIGGRLGYSIRGTLQSQSKAFVDFQHESRMNKIKAVLDQETWAAVDVPDEFQAITDSFLSSEALVHGNGVDTYGVNLVSWNDGSLVIDGVPSEEQPLRLNDSAMAADHPNQVMSEDGDNSENLIKALTSSVRKVDGNTNEQGRSTSQALVFRGVSYHMVNCGLILLKMLSEYIDINRCLPALSSEVVHRVAEILKFFNTRACQLVLGAGAMQVSGLKSITSKHLALASQVISFIYALMPGL